jgi:hypothetical protein
VNINISDDFGSDFVVDAFDLALLVQVQHLLLVFEQVDHYLDQTHEQLVLAVDRSKADLNGLVRNF